MVCPALQGRQRVLVLHVVCVLSCFFQHPRPIDPLRAGVWSQSPGRPQADSHTRSPGAWLPGREQILHQQRNTALSFKTQAAQSHPKTIDTPSAGDLRELPRVPLRGEGSCGGGGSPQLYPFLHHLCCSCMHAKSLELCLTLCDPMDCSPPGSSVHGILK